MKTFYFFNAKLDKKFIICAIICFILGIICSIVLYKSIIYNIYFKNFASDYIFKVFNFKSGALAFSLFFSELVFLYAFVLISYFSKLKYLTLLLILLKSFFIGIYLISLVCVNALSGVIVIVFVFLPTSIFALVLNFLSVELCFYFNDFKVIFLPLIFCVLNCLVLFILHNLIFRFIVAIV